MMSEITYITCEDCGTRVPENNFPLHRARACGGRARAPRMSQSNSVCPIADSAENHSGRRLWSTNIGLSRESENTQRVIDLTNADTNNSSIGITNDDTNNNSIDLTNDDTNNSSIDVSNNKWSCPQCTLLNSNDQRSCEACHYTITPNRGSGVVRNPDPVRSERLVNDDPPIFANNSENFGSGPSFQNLGDGSFGASLYGDMESDPFSVLHSMMHRDHLHRAALNSRVAGARSQRDPLFSQESMRQRNHNHARNTHMGFHQDPSPNYDRNNSQNRSSSFHTTTHTSSSNGTPPRRTSYTFGMTSNNGRTSFFTSSDGDDGDGTAFSNPRNPRTPFFPSNGNNNGNGMAPNNRRASFFTTGSNGVRNGDRNAGNFDTSNIDTMMRSMMRYNIGGRSMRMHMNNMNGMNMNTDGMDYEQLLRAFGNGTENMGASAETISTLPTSVIKNVENELPEGDARTCSICLEDFEIGDKRKILPCLHSFHEHCIDRSLQHRSCCPICNVSVNG